MKKIIILLILITIIGIPAIHKLVGDFVPTWFYNKFSDSLINKIPFGINISYGIIIILEIVAPILFIIGLLKREYLQTSSGKFISLGFMTSYVLFTILTFGSFLIEDYSNGFNDFIYFVGISVLESKIFSKEQ
jgi:hypothetical protein